LRKPQQKMIALSMSMRETTSGRSTSKHRG
jgi:hypothetical protein